MLIAGDVVTHDQKTEGLVLGPVRGDPRHVAILLPPGKNRAARVRHVDKNDTSYLVMISPKSRDRARRLLDAAGHAKVVAMAGAAVNLSHLRRLFRLPPPDAAAAGTAIVPTKSVPAVPARRHGTAAAATEQVVMPIGAGFVILNRPIRGEFECAPQKCSAQGKEDGRNLSRQNRERPPCRPGRGACPAARCRRAMGR